ncbi:MAG: amidohydrolase family protein [Candidatus Brockarchaeota archaeon]|nr:amidohydrolase family protein [Candidatus Brockarchaeota archaeon]
MQAEKRLIVDVNTVFGAYPKRKTDVSLKNLLRTMDLNGVEKALTASLKGAFYSYEEGNEETLKACNTDKRLIPLATVDPRRFVSGRVEIENLTRSGFKGIRLFKDIQGYPLDYSPVIEIIESMEGLGVPLLVPCNEYGCITLLSRLTAEKDYPVIVLGCTYSLLSEFIVSARRNRNLYVETRLLTSSDAIEILVEKVGASRLIFGSGIPLEYFQASYRMVESAKIREEDKDMILGGNILRILKEAG